MMVIGAKYKKVIAILVRDPQIVNFLRDLNLKRSMGVYVLDGVDAAF